MALFPAKSARTCLVAIVIVVSTALAQSTASASPAAAIATSFPSTSNWEYVGCQNETTLTNGTDGARALSGGTSETLDTMTVDTCLNYCASGSFAFAGLEYTSECYCAQFLSALSTKLPDSACNLACKGNSSQVCGGPLALTVYQAKSSKKGAGIKVQQAPMSSILALGIALAVLLCLA